MIDTHTTTVAGAAAHAVRLGQHESREWYEEDRPAVALCAHCDLPLDARDADRDYWRHGDSYRTAGERYCADCARHLSPIHYGPDGTECRGRNTPREWATACPTCDAPTYVCGCGCECDRGDADELRGPHGCPDAPIEEDV